MDKAKNEKLGLLARFQQLWKTNPLFSTGIALIVMVVVQTLALTFNSSYEGFGGWFMSWLNNWISILRGNAAIGIIALGMTFVIISGGIDLSVGSVYVAVGAFTMVLLDEGPNGWLGAIGVSGIPAILIALVAAAAFGSLLGEGNGLLISNGKMPPSSPRWAPCRSCAASPSTL